jgi:hypothetical protein
MKIVWFNGPSMKQFLDIPMQDVEVGCNFIRKIRSVHHVCAFDQQVVDRLEQEKNVSYWTRDRCLIQGFKTPESKWPSYDSGTLALNVASVISNEPIHLLGFDWSETDKSVFNKLYTWRDHDPQKASSHKIKLIMNIATTSKIIVVHKNRKDFLGSDVAWIGPKEFMDLI